MSTLLWLFLLVMLAAGIIGIGFNVARGKSVEAYWEGYADGYLQSCIDAQTGDHG